MCRNGCSRVLALATLLLVGIPVVLCNSYFVHERWPHGQTRAIRQGMEAVLSPPPGAEFVEVVRDRPLAGAYSETIYYRSDLADAEILEYYHAAFQECGWTVKLRASSLFAMDRPTREMTVVPIPSPHPSGQTVRISYDESQPKTRAEVSLYFWPANSSWVSEPYTYTLGSPSLVEVAKVLAECGP